MPEPILISSISGTVISGAILATVGGTAAVAAWRWIEQSRNIIRVAFNVANEHEVQLFEKGVLHDTPFRQLAGQYEACFASCCCGNVKFAQAARRLRIGLRRVVEEGLQLPPFGSPLLDDDDSPRAAHTPIEERDPWEQLHLIEHAEFQRNEVIKRLRRERGWPDYYQNLLDTHGVQTAPSAAEVGQAGPPARHAGPGRLAGSLPASGRPSLDYGGLAAAEARSHLGTVTGVPARSYASAQGLGSPRGGDRGAAGQNTGAPRGGDVGPGGAGETGQSESARGGFVSRFRTQSTGSQSISGLSALTPSARPGPGRSPLSGTWPAELEMGPRRQRDPVQSARDWVAPPGVAGPDPSRPVSLELARRSSLYAAAPAPEPAAQPHRSEAGLSRAGRSQSGQSQSGHSQSGRSEGGPSGVGRSQTSSPGPSRHGTVSSGQDVASGRTTLPRIESAADVAAQEGFSGAGFSPPVLSGAGPSVTDLPGWANFRGAQPAASSSRREASQGGVSQSPATPEKQTAADASRSLSVRTGRSQERTPITESRGARGAAQAPPAPARASSPARSGSREPPHRMISLAVTNLFTERANEEREAARRNAARSGASGAAIPGQAVSSRRPRGSGSGGSGSGSGSSSPQQGGSSEGGSPGGRSPGGRSPGGRSHGGGGSQGQGSGSQGQRGASQRRGELAGEDDSVGDSPRESRYESPRGSTRGAPEGAVAARARAFQQAGSSGSLMSTSPVSPIASPTASATTSPQRRAAHPLRAVTGSPGMPPRSASSQSMGMQ